MSTARVDDIEILKVFRAQLIKFAEAANVAMGDAESEIHRTLNWLDNEQLQKWSTELRKRQAKLAQAQEALRMKKIFTGPAGSRQSCVDEEKAVQKAMRAMAEAEQKIVAVKQWGRRLQKELLIYKGQTQRFATSISVDIPLAASVLGNMVARLENYASLAPLNARSAAGSESSAAGGMAQPIGGDAAAIAAAFATLRDSTPKAPARAAGPVEAINLAPIASQVIAEADAQTLKELPGTAPIDTAGTLVVSTAIADKGRLYLERVGPCKPGDTGWFIGPAEVQDNPFVVTFSVADILAKRPEWTSLLSLPTGSLVILDMGAIAAVLDTSNTDLWAAASMKRLTSDDAAPSDGATKAQTPPPAPTEQPAASGV